MKYKIEKKTTYQLNQTGSKSSIVDNVRYYIKYKQTLFGIFPYWRYYEIDNCMYGDCVKFPVVFHSLEDADEFATKYICNGITHDTIIEETVKEFEC
jgi:hypothetical protein